MLAAEQATINRDVEATALKTAIAILDKWECTPDQAWAILGMKKSSYYKNRDNTATARMTHDQLERVSYILNIHAALRVIFDNPDNVSGFMRMKNHNPYFNGASPLDIIASGNFGALYETYRRIDALRGAGL